MAKHRLWLLPSLGLVISLSVLRVYQLDETLSSLFYRQGSWPLRHHPWLEGLLHRDAQNLGRLVFLAVSARAAWLAWKGHPWSAWAYCSCCVALCVGLISLLKHSLPFACPWDMTDHLGRLLPPFTPLPDLPGCFPAGHASTGYAWLCLYPVACRLAPAWRLPALLAALLSGTLLGAVQQARGAHFVSHDLASLYIGWMIAQCILAVWPNPHFTSPHPDPPP